MFLNDDDTFACLLAYIAIILLCSIPLSALARIIAAATKKGPMPSSSWPSINVSFPFYYYMAMKLWPLFFVALLCSCCLLIDWLLKVFFLLAKDNEAIKKEKMTGM